MHRSTLFLDRFACSSEFSFLLSDSPQLHSPFQPSLQYASEARHDGLCSEQVADDAPLEGNGRHQNLVANSLDGRLFSRGPHDPRPYGLEDELLAGKDVQSHVIAGDLAPVFSQCGNSLPVATQCSVPECLSMSTLAHILISPWFP